MPDQKEEILKQFGANLRRIRLEKAKTQEQLAEDLGVSQVQIARIETGVINTSIYNYRQLAIILDVSMDEFWLNI